MNVAYTYACKPHNFISTAKAVLVPSCLDLIYGHAMHILQQPSTVSAVLPPYFRKPECQTQREPSVQKQCVLVSCSKCASHCYTRARAHAHTRTRAHTHTRARLLSFLFTGSARRTKQLVFLFVQSLHKDIRSLSHSHNISCSQSQPVLKAAVGSRTDLTLQSTPTKLRCPVTSNTEFWTLALFDVLGSSEKPDRGVSTFRHTLLFPFWQHNPDDGDSRLLWNVVSTMSCSRSRDRACTGKCTVRVQVPSFIVLSLIVLYLSCTSAVPRTHAVRYQYHCVLAAARLKQTTSGAAAQLQLSACCQFLPPL
jgi:hypothetical protein